MNRLYLAGPMTGIEDLNFPAFHAEAARLRALGYTVINPAEINADPNAGWQACMRIERAQAQGKLFEPEPPKQTQEELL